MTTTKVFVGNLPEAARKGDFKKMFEDFGKVVECDIVRNYGFVHFEKEDEAKAAVAALNNSDFEGSEIKVEISHSKVRQKPGMGGHGECYRCGRNGHWSKDCPRGPSRNRRKMDGRGGGGEGFGNYYRQGPFMNPYNDRYPPSNDRYPPPNDRYPPSNDRYPPPNDRYPPSNDRYPPPNDRYPPSNDRYPPPPPMPKPTDRYRPYPEAPPPPYERRPPMQPLPPPMNRPPYDFNRDPYERPPPEYYRRSSPQRPSYQDPYFDSGYNRRSGWE